MIFQKFFPKNRIVLAKCLLFLLVFISYNIIVRSQEHLLTKLSSPILFKGDKKTAFRDPAVLYHKGVFYLYFTLVKTQQGKVYSYTAMSFSKNLRRWSTPKILTPKDQSLDFSSPGNIIKYNDEWVMCLQSYPRPDYLASDMPKFANQNARLYLMRSKDLLNWSVPELIKVKGNNIPFDKMGRMIDPYLIEDIQEKGKCWVFYKQNGVSMSYTYDFKNWTFFGNTESGENACVLKENNEYILFHSPKNGIAIKRSSDMRNWKNWGSLITLGQNSWNWAKGRISAGTVINLKSEPNIQNYIMFFHGSGPLSEEQGDFDKNSSIGIAWSKNLSDWHWPAK